MATHAEAAFYYYWGARQRPLVTILEGQPLFQPQLGMATVTSWGVEDVLGWLDGLGLGHLREAFRLNAVSGSDLVALSESDLIDHLLCTKLQARKIARELAVLGVQLPAAAGAVQAPAPATAPAPPAQAPSGDSQKIALELAELEKQAAEVRGHAGQFGQAFNLASQAAAELQQALGSLGATQAVGAVGMVRSARRGAVASMAGASPMQRRGFQRMGGLGGTVLSSATVQRANALVQQAAKHVDQARRVVPNMPAVDTAALDSARRGIFLNVLAPGVLGGAMQMSAVGRSKSTVELMAGQVGQCAQWLQLNQRAAEAKANQISAAAAVKQGELNALRAS